LTKISKSIIFDSFTKLLKKRYVSKGCTIESFGIFNIFTVLIGLLEETSGEFIMNKKEQAHFKAKLEAMSQDILDEAEKTLLEMTDQSENYPDPADRATAESNRNFELRIRDRERKLLAKIKEALERLDNGTYGICETCEEDISAKRLEARPVTTLCVKCKTAQEQHEKEHAQP
jgi:DnaK suppressor protein